MPLNLSNRDQTTGHLFHIRRLRAAITRYSVRMRHDDRKQQAALVLSAVFVLLGCGWMALLGVMKPAGLAGQSPIVGNRNTGALYARIDGRLHPALNLTSARLATGSASEPAWVEPSEIERFPSGPMIGIPGIHDGLTIAPTPLSAWTVCDTASRRGSLESPTVTAIAGEITAGERARPLQESEAILATHKGVAVLIWDGHRTRLDLSERAVTFNLGLDTAKSRPIEISTALFNAIPATEPLTVPTIPQSGTQSRWLPGSVVGRVIQTQDATGAVTGFFVLLTNGVQRITPFVADLLRTADSHGVVAPQLIPPDKLIGIPQVEVLNVDYFPTGKLKFIDTAANPVTCMSWQKQSTDPQATMTVLTGRGLPTPHQFDSHIVRLVGTGNDRWAAQAAQTLVLPGAATLVASTSGALRTDTREGLFWVSAQGVRYGIESDEPTLQALDIEPNRALQAPWPILRIFATGPVISRANALVSRDTIEPVDGKALFAGER